MPDGSVLALGEGNTQRAKVVKNTLDIPRPSFLGRYLIACSGQTSGLTGATIISTAAQLERMALVPFQAKFDSLQDGSSPILVHACEGVIQRSTVASSLPLLTTHLGLDCFPRKPSWPEK